MEEYKSKVMAAQLFELLLKKVTPCSTKYYEYASNLNKALIRVEELKKELGY